VRRADLSTCLGSSPAMKVRDSLRSTTVDADIGALTSMTGSSFFDDSLFVCASRMSLRRQTSLKHTGI